MDQKVRIGQTKYAVFLGKNTLFWPPPNRKGFSHREADDKSLLDEVRSRGRGSVGGCGEDGRCAKVGWSDWVAGLSVI
jgi:hypothetical protein